jgi:hypothetical protein
MYPATAAFRAAIVNSHTVIAKAEIWASDQKLSTLNIANGSVTVSAKNATRRVCEVTLSTSRDADNDVPDNDYDLLTPFGNELRLYRGIQYSDGTQEYIPLGVFVITDVAINDRADGVAIKVMGEDRSLIVGRSKWLEPYQMVSGTLEASITALLQSRYSDVQVSFPTTGITIGQVILGADKANDPWKDAVQICELVGYDLYFDVTGVVTMKPFPTLDGAVVVATYEEGNGTTITELDRTISTKETFNGVVYTVSGTQVTTPIKVTVWDEDSTSPTYRFGKFGQVPIFISSNLVQTTAAATTAATNLLYTYIGSQETINWNSLVDPTLDVQDVVYVKSVGAKVNRLVIIDSFSLPLSPDSQMKADARIVRVVATGEKIQVGA